MDIIGFGALNLDELCGVERIAKSGEEVTINDLVTSPGGSAANTIVGLSRLDFKTGFIGMMGNDQPKESLIFKVKMYIIYDGCHWIRSIKLR